MFQNSNARFVLNLSKKNYKSNRSRNTVGITAIMLTAFMIITVVSLGFSYINAYNLQQLQLLGTTGDAVLDNPNDSQMKLLEEFEGIADVGIRQDIIQAGSVEYKTANSGLYYAFRYYDNIEWNQHRKPVLENVVGNYPKTINEVMIPKWVLIKMGIPEAKEGDEITFSYRSQGKLVNDNFILSGFFNEYDNSTKDGSVAYILVSEAFAAANSNQLESMTRIADISFDKSISVKKIEQLETSLNLDSQQTFSVNPNMQTQIGLDVMILVGFIIVCIIAGGYLLIYNIFSISITNNIHYFGQLKVIGITKNQIKGILLWQGAKMAVIGCAIGCVIGFVFSNFMIPILLNSILGSKNSTVDFNFFVILGTVIFTGITVFISILRPACIAGNISPIDAIRYETAPANTKSKKKKSRKSSFAFMAIENVLRDKKRFILVLLSMSLGITSCMTIEVLISGMDTDNYVKNNMESDMELKNRTVALGYREAAKQVFDTDLLEYIQNLEGVTEINTITQQLIAPEYSEGVFGKYVNSMILDESMDSRYFAKNPDSFYSQLIGIDISEIIKKQYPDIDWIAFESGDICLIPNDNPELIDKNQSISYKLGSYDNATGKALIRGEEYRIKIGGYISELYNNYGSVRTVAPHIIVSKQYLESISKDAFITNVMIHLDKKYEKSVNSSILSFISEYKYSDDIVTVSALEKTEGLIKAKITLYGMGGSLAIVIALIGIINFINVIYTGISERKKDFTIMESIGVRKKQIIQMITFECLIYFGMTMILTMTVGNIILFIIYRIFSGMVTYMEFSYPFILLGCIGVLLLLLCNFVPRKAMNKKFSASIVERMKTGD